MIQLVGAANVRSSTTDGMLSLLQGEITLAAEEGGSSFVVSWRSSSPLVEMMADALIALLTAVEGIPASIPMCGHAATKNKHAHSTEEKCYIGMEVSSSPHSYDMIEELLANYYEDVQRHSSNAWEIIVAEKQEKAPYHLRIVSGPLSPVVVSFFLLIGIGG